MEEENTKKNISFRKFVPFFLLALLLITMIFAFINRKTLMNSLMKTFLSPKAYAVTLETNYLTDKSRLRAENLKTLADRCAKENQNSITVEAAINKLIGMYLPISLPFNKLSLTFRAHSYPDWSVLSAHYIIDKQAMRQTNLYFHPEDRQVMIGHPTHSSEALSFTLPDSRLFRLAIHYFEDVAASLNDFIVQLAENDPYPYLLDYVSVLSDVTITEHVTIPNEQYKATDTPAETCTVLTGYLLFDEASEIASRQLNKISNEYEIPLLLEPYYALLTNGLESFAEKESVKLKITLYADSEGNILNHEFELTSGEELLIALTGFPIRNSETGSITGERLLSLPFFDGTDSKIDIRTIRIGYRDFSVNPQTGFYSGKINLSSPEQALFSINLLFPDNASLPTCTLNIPVAGINIASLTFSLSSIEDRTVAVPPDFDTLVPISHINEFFKSWTD